MMLGTFDDPEFANLILKLVPRVAGLPLVQAAMKKYTSGYLNETRLANAAAPGFLPTITLGAIGGGAGGQQSGDSLVIDRNYFKGFKERHPTYVTLVPITVFHELGHWGYWKGQQEGHKSDKFGRAHNNHGENLSPLSAELQTIFGMLIALKMW
jgi:hypothetical protein